MKLLSFTITARLGPYTLQTIEKQDNFGFLGNLRYWVLGELFALVLSINHAWMFAVPMAESESQKLQHELNENGEQIYSRPNQATRVRSGNVMFY